MICLATSTIFTPSQAICIRSIEGRKRILNEIVATLLLGSPTPKGANAKGVPTAAVEFSPEERTLALAPVEGPVGASRFFSAASSCAFEPKPGRPHPAKIRVFVALLATLCQTPAAGTGATDPRQPDPSTLAATADVVRTMRELGAARALAWALRSVDAGHPHSGPTTSAVLKPLEVLTRNMANWFSAAKASAGSAARPHDATTTVNGSEGQQAAADVAAAGGSAAPDDGAVGSGVIEAAADDLHALHPEADAEVRRRRRRRHGSSRMPTVQQLIQEIDMAMGELEADSDDVVGDSDADMGDEGESDGEGEDEDMEGEEDDDDDDDGDGDALELQMPDGQIITVVPNPNGDGYMAEDGERALSATPLHCMY